MRYTKEQLNTKHPRTNDDFVCKIDKKEQWDRLKEICPKISKYDRSRKYYLCQRGGYSEKPYYTTIEFTDINFEENYEIY